MTKTTAFSIQKVAILGSGNIASWLAFKLFQQKIQIVQIYSQTIEHAQKLAQSYHANPIDQISSLIPDLDLYIFSLKDDCYQSVIQQIKFKMPLAVITAGSVSQKILADKAVNYGVIYPCQSISKSLITNDLDVPLCIEGNSSETTKLLQEFSQLLSDKIYLIDEKQRKILHLAAVFASNFTNAMYGIANDILLQNDMNPKMILPLLQNTLDKIERNSPWQVQTGPAKRNDKNVMNQQLELLSDAQLQDIYKLISYYIIKKTNQQ